MGPNRQRKPRDAGRQQQRRQMFVQRQKSGPERPAVSSLGKDTREAVIDVLQHVAGAAPVPENFDPSQSSSRGGNTIVFKKNTALTPHQVLQLLFEKLGYPPDVVAQYVDELVAKPDTPMCSTIREYGDNPRNAAWVKACCWDLFETMLWNSEEGNDALTRQEEEAGGADDGLGDPEAAAQFVEDELETVSMVFTDDLRGVLREGFDGEDADDTAAELKFVMPCEDGVNAAVVIRLPSFYPQENPLVRIELSDEQPVYTERVAEADRARKKWEDAEEKRKRDHAKATSRGGRGGRGKGAPAAEAPAPSMPPPPAPAKPQLSPQLRRSTLDAAVSAVAACIGVPGGLVPLIAGMKDTLAGLPSTMGLKVADPVSEAKAAKEREAALAAKKADANSRAAFVDALAVDVAPEVAAKRVAAKEAQEADDDIMKDRPAPLKVDMPSAVQLDALDTEQSAAQIRAEAHGAQPKRRKDPAIDAQLLKDWKNLEVNGSLAKVRQNLPAAAVREELRKVVQSSQVVVIGGETGSGKTTQVPQFLLEYALEANEGSTVNIVCTQPRRLAATAVAMRVAEERDEQIGGTVGYSIRLENKSDPRRTRLLYCTTGIVLRRLQVDPMLSNITHVVVDEIHERGVDTDFLLILLKDLLTKRKDIKVILMSATMNSELFSKYFFDAPVVSIAGRTHPVEVFFLENILNMTNYVVEDGGPYAKAGAGRKRNKSRHLSQLDYGRMDAADEADTEEQKRALISDAGGAAANPDLAKAADALALMDLDVINYELIEQLVDYIDQTYKFEGAILVFLPGLAEILRCCDELRSNPRLAQRCVIHNLHSSLGSSTQQAVFGRAPRGKRKVVVGTNIMETSITIDDAVFVIDAGKFKENRYDAKKSMSQLVTCWVAKANANQRKGRAGRVRPGYCFRLYTTPQFKKLEDHQLCEMHRVPLESLVLQIYTLNLGDEVEYLQKALSPPEEKAIRASVSVLQGLGALTREKRLTSLGFHLAQLPLDVRIGKMIIHGALLKCVDPVITIAACLSVRSPFQNSMEDMSEINATRKGFDRGNNSDLLTSWHGYHAWISTYIKVGGGSGPGKAAVRKFCEEAWLSAGALSQIQATKRQYERYLVEAGFIENASTAKDANRRRNPNEFMFQPYVTLDDLAYEAGGQANNSNAANAKCITACLLAGLYPNVARLVRTPKKPKAVRIHTLDGSEVVVHPSSLNSNASEGKDVPYQLLLYVDKVKTSQTFLRETSAVSPLQVVLFGGQLKYLPQYGELVVDDYVGFRVSEEEAVLLTHLREQLDSVLSSKINDPTTSWERVALNVVKVITRILREEGVGGNAIAVVDKSERKPLTSPLQAAPEQETAPANQPPGVPYAARKCHECGQFGHLAQHCPKPKPKERGAATVKCFVCGEWHHPVKCPLTRGGAEGGK